MRNPSALFTAALFLAVSSSRAPAAQAPLSPEQLEGDATHIVVGEVAAVESKLVSAGRGLLNKNYEIRIKLVTVSKGDGVKKGDTITVHAWKPAKGILPRPPGLQGHSIPAKGDKVKVFLKKDGDTYPVIHPNGFEPVKAEPKP